MPAGQHSEAGCSCLQCLQTWAHLQLWKVHELDWYLMQISLPWWKTDEVGVLNPRGKSTAAGVSGGFPGPAGFEQPSLMQNPSPVGTLGERDS